MRWIVYEDSKAEQLCPLALTRPVFELICGREGLRRRVQRWFPAAGWGVQIRSWLTDVYSEKHPDATVNQLPMMHDSAVLFINGRWIPEHRISPAEINVTNAGFVGEDLAWIALSAEEANLLSDVDLESMLAGMARSRDGVPASGVMIERPWDLVNRNARQLELDFADEGVSEQSPAPHVQCLGSPSDLYVSQQAEIDPYVVIDTRSGPVSIDRDVHIESFTRIQGPCHVAWGSQLIRANIHRGTTIGPCSRVGGEVEESILHGYVNKYHDGFLGHSYVCPWVNLGAMTTTSDLKSDYSNVTVPLQGEMIDTQTTKVGSFIGDHSKTAIDSMFNTGSSIGVMTMVLPGGRLLPRHIPSFCNVSFGDLAEDWPLEQSLATARTAMQRRGFELTSAQESLYREIHRRTSAERSAAVDLSRQKRISRSIR